MSSSITAKDCSPFLISKGNDQAIIKLCNYFESTKKDNVDDDEQIVSLRTTKFDGEVQTKWWAGRYIGLAKLSIGKTQVDISIHPRFGQSFLLSILEDLYGIKNTKESTHDGKVYQSNEWFSALLNILRRRTWVDKCAKANRYGLPRVNIKRGYQGVSLRGALDVRRTLMPWLLKREVCTNVYEKTFDDTICRIVYEAHRILSQNVIDNKVGRGRKKNSSQTNNVGFGFSMPPAVQDTIDALNYQYKGTAFNLKEADYQRIQYKSIYVSWKPLVDFSWDVIRNRQLGYRTAENQTQCIFVDMAEIWEAFLRKKLGEGFANERWRVLSIEECTYKIYSGQFYRRDIIPDIILTRQNEKGEKEYMVFDAKYKRMRGIKTNVKNSDVDRSDLFQIHTYIQYVEQQMGHVVVGGLLYPITTKDDNGQEYGVPEDFNKAHYHSLHLFGDDGKCETPFIIDGIPFSEQENDDKLNEKQIKANAELLDSNVNDMINRIKNTFHHRINPQTFYTNIKFNP